jgi:hypothetical protein
MPANNTNSSYIVQRLRVLRVANSFYHLLLSRPWEIKMKSTYANTLTLVLCWMHPTLLLFYNVYGTALWTTPLVNVLDKMACQHGRRQKKGHMANMWPLIRAIPTSSSTTFSLSHAVGWKVNKIHIWPFQARNDIHIFSVTSQKGNCMYITKIIRLRLFREIISVYCDSDINHKNTFRGQNVDIWYIQWPLRFKQVVTSLFYYLVWTKMSVAPNLLNRLKMWFNYKK